jgi:hypothetical protein
MATRSLLPALVLVPLFACAPESDDGSVFTSGDDDVADDEIDDSGSESEGTGSTTDEGDDETTTDDDGNTTGIKLDTLPPDTGVDDGPIDEGCDFVDVLFVIDNSVSMGGYQDALGIAFPQFAETLAATLEVGTNLHVAVTSSEMGYASSGSTSINNGVCTFTGDGGQPNTAFYVTPDQQNTGKNGAQGRLFDPGDGQRFFELEIGDDVGPLAAWFADAAAIGTGGSNIEMETGPAGWFVDPANAPTNAGFLRDEGAVLVVFFMTDEPDQTPLVIDGMSGGQAMLAKVAAAKDGCGGLECVIGGGFLLESACSDGQPLEEYLNGLSEPPTIAPLPDEDLEPALAAEEMNALLADTLADAIAAKCEEIEPVG